MPELPEVEAGRRVAEAVGLGRTIETVWCDRDPIVFEGERPGRIRRALAGAVVQAVSRHGKHLWFELDRPLHPLFHFGMTGAFRTPGANPLRLSSSASERDESEWPPRFRKIHFGFHDGGELVMTNKRRLGRIRLRQDPRGQPPVSLLGFDPLWNLPAPRAFADRMSRRSAGIKSLLLDQSFAAGIGNWIADEVLYQSRIDPRRRADELSAEETERIRRKIGLIVRRAVRVNADSGRFPAAWLFHRRWGKKRDARDARGERVQFLEVAGRTTAWVPSRQQ